MSATLDRLYRKARERRIPLSGSLELTWRCNLRCVHCFQDSQRDRFEEMSTDEWKRLIDEMARAGCLRLTLTGGEPLVRADFREIYEHAHARGFLITLFTNGALLREEHLELLAERPPRAIEVTLYGASAARYEEVSGCGAAFEPVMSATRALAKRGLPLTLKTVVTRQLAGEFASIRGVAEELGVGFRWDSTVVPRLDGDKAPLAWRLGPQQSLLLERAALGSASERCPQGAARGEELLTCAATRTAFNVGPDGSLTGCVLLRQPAFSAREFGFFEAWERLGEVSLLRRSAVAGTCGSCDLWAYCRCCPAVSNLEQGSPEAPVEYHCRLAAMRQGSSRGRSAHECRRQSRARVP